jgi:hypothetical protein
MIGHLTAYQKKLIAVTKPRPLCEGWHDFRTKEVDKTRDGRDKAVLIMHIGFCAAALIIAALREFSRPEGADAVLQVSKPEVVEFWRVWSLLSGNPQWPGWFSCVKVGFFLFSAGCAIWSWIVIVNTQKERIKLSQLTKEEQKAVVSILAVHLFGKAAKKSVSKEVQTLPKNTKSRRIL